MYQTGFKEFAHIEGLKSKSESVFKHKIIILCHLHITGATIQRRFLELYNIHFGTWTTCIDALKSAKLVRTNRSKRFIRVFNTFVKVESYTLTTKGRQVTEQYLSCLRDKAAKIESGEINF